MFGRLVARVDEQGVEHLGFRQGLGLLEGLIGCPSETVLAAVRPLVVVRPEPRIQIGL